MAFNRIAIINRGEPAVRFLRAMREYNIESDLCLQGIVFFTESDRYAPFVRQADEAVFLGEPMRTVDPTHRDAESSSSSDKELMVSAYCDHEYIRSLLKEHRCDAVWPGWGFVSEDPSFVKMLEEEGIVFIGPSSEAMYRLGDKIAAKYMAKACNVPLAPWAELVDQDDSQTLLAKGERVGYPLMVKASAGGGGRGIIKVSSSEDLLPAIRSVREQVAKVFGAGGILLERAVHGARHIEVQLVVNHKGEAFSLGIRDCSIQRKNQKIIEEAPSPVLPPDVEELLCSSARRLAAHAGYQGVGTAEFLYNPTTGLSTFLEVNSRLQVEHTITELIFGCDLVKAQIAIARKEIWRQSSDQPRGHAIELRVNAENPEKDFQPSPGILRIFRSPSGPGVRVDSGVVEGMEISPHFDSMIAKIIAYAPTRPQAIARGLRACQELEAIVEDGSTNQAFLCELLQHKQFVEATADTSWLDRETKAGGIRCIRYEPEALMAAAILEYEILRNSVQKRFFIQSQDGIPQQIPVPEGTNLELRLRDVPWSMWVHKRSADLYSVGLKGAFHLVQLHEISPGVAEFKVGSMRHKVLYSYGQRAVAVDVDGYNHPVERATGGVVRSPAPGVVVSIDVQEGDQVQVGDRLCTLEAMKMELGVFASEEGVISTVYCRPNQQVASGEAILLMEEHGGAVSEDHLEDFPKAHHGFPVCTPEELVDLEEMMLVRSVVWTVLKGFACEEELLQKVEQFFSQDFSEVRNFRLWHWLTDALELFGDVGLLMDRNTLLEKEGELSLPADVAFFEFCRRYKEGEEGAITALRPMLKRALRWYDIDDLGQRRSVAEALLRIAMVNTHVESKHRLCSSILCAMMQLHEAGMRFNSHTELVLERVALATKDSYPFVRDNAVQAEYILFNRKRYALRAKTAKDLVETLINHVARLDPTHRRTRDAMNKIVDHPHALQPALLTIADVGKSVRWRVLEALVRRLYIGTSCVWVRDIALSQGAALCCEVTDSGQKQQLLGVLIDCLQLEPLLKELSKCPQVDLIEFVLSDPLEEEDELLKDTVAKILDFITVQEWTPLRISISWRSRTYGERHRSYRLQDSGFVEQELLRNIHPEAARRVELWRLQNFNLTRLAGHDRIYAFLGHSPNNIKDERIFICGEIFGKMYEDDKEPFWPVEQIFFEAIKVLREAQSKRTRRNRLNFNWMHFYIHSPFSLQKHDLRMLAARLEPHTRGLNVQEVNVRARIKPKSPYDPPESVEIILKKPGRYRLSVDIRKSSSEPLKEMTPYDMRVVRASRIGCTYPYEIIRMLEGEINSLSVRAPHLDMGQGEFQEYDLDDNNDLVPVDRPYGENTCGVVIGVVSNVTRKHPEGIQRVWIGSDSTKAMGALAEQECRRVLGALQLAERAQLPVEWIPVSSGAMISMKSGTENLDWTAQVLKAIVEFTQRGGIINIIVHGVNVGAQSYWNAEATMLMHTKGILIMTLSGSMVLTGKKALDFSGGVSAEDERGIGGAERIMGPNGQAQLVVQDLGEAYGKLFEWYRYSYIAKGENRVRSHPTEDRRERSILPETYPEENEHFKKIGDIFDPKTNPGRKKTFSIRAVMGVVMDQDDTPLERYMTMRDGESAVSWDAHVGGHAVTMIGIESRPLLRRGRIPMDGPESWTGGTLFPKSSKKVARAINSASGIRPVVVLANLSGFDGSPESMRRLQLQLGAEIGRAVVNFEGTIVFLVIGRYHGGAYVVFSKDLNPNLRALAVEGSFASVIGGAPAAAVVFPRNVKQLVEQDKEYKALLKRLSKASAVEKSRVRDDVERLWNNLILEKRGEVATQFDAIHSVQRAVEVNSLDRIIKPKEIRSAIIDELERSYQTPTKSKT